MSWIPQPVPKPKSAPKRVVMKRCSVRSKKSGGHLFPGNVSKPRRAFIRKERCIATGAKTGEVVFARPWMPPTLQQLCPYVAKVIVAHVESRGAGHRDEANIVPLEAQLHELVGQKGWKWLEGVCRLMPVREIALRFEHRYAARAAAIAKNQERARGRD